MEEIKEKLSEKYLKMEDHFNISFEVFKKLISENKLIIIIYFLLSLANNYLIIEMRNIFIIMNQSGYSYIPEEVLWLSPLIIVIGSFMYIMGIIFIKKTVMKVENKTDLNFKAIIIKSFKLCVVFILFYLAFILLIALLAGFSTIFLALGKVLNLGGEATKIFSIIFLIVIFLFAISCMIWITLSTLYFFPLYFSRNVKLREAFVYNRHLCKGNRMKIILPWIVIIVFQLLIGLPFGFMNMFTFSTVFLWILFIIRIFIDMIFNIYCGILFTVIYLNVEYMDLKEYNNTDDDNDIQKIEAKNNLFENDKEN